MPVTTSTYLADAKVIYGAIQEQVSTLPAFMNLLGDGAKFGKPVTDEIGVRGYTFLARMGPNWSLGHRAEGTTGVGAAGNQNLANATVNLVFAYVPITITGQAENLTKGNQRAFMQAKALEAKFDMKDIVSWADLLIAGGLTNGQIAQVAAAPAPGAGSFTAASGVGLPAALFLRNGMSIDAYPVGGGALSLTAAQITAINYGSGAITHNGGTATAGHAVSLAGESIATSGGSPVTPQCLDQIINSSGALQGLNPATAGQSAWASFDQDAGDVALSSQLIMELKQFVKNRGGEDTDFYLFPSAQINQLVGIATTTLRFDVNSGKAIGKKALDLGFTVFDYAGSPVVEEKNMLPDRIRCGASEMMKKFEAVPLSLAEDEAGAWTRVSGTNGIADAVMGLLRWYYNVGCLQRSAFGTLFDLTVPTTFQTNPPTL